MRASSATIHRTLIGLLVVALTLEAASASADPIAIETYVGRRPVEAERVMVRLRAVLQKHGYVAQPASLKKLFAEHETQPGLIDASFNGEKMSSAILKGANAFDDLDFKEAAKSLGATIQAARANPVILAKEPKYREAMHRALLVYALARGRLSNDDQRAADAEKTTSKRDELAAKATAEATDRDETMAELIRSFPTKVIIAKDSGQEAEALFQRIRKDVDKLGRGKLSVKVNDPDAIIYVDEIIRGQSTIAIGDLVVGPYRVLVQSSTGEWRQYNVDVMANQTSRLDIDWDLDSMLSLRDWVGFEYPTEKAHGREAELVVKLARQSMNAALASAFTVTRSSKHLAVVGTIYKATDGTLVRSGQVELSSSTDEKALEQLVNYLDGQASTGVVAVDHPEYTRPNANDLPARNEPSKTAVASTPLKTPVAINTTSPIARPTSPSVPTKNPPSTPIARPTQPTVAVAHDAPSSKPPRTSTVRVPTPTTNADSREVRAARAEALFEEGRKLNDAGKTRDACVKFDEALQLNRNAVGTILNVALCDENLGKVASASKLFEEARDRASEQNLGEHAKAADDHLTKLASRVPHLAITFAEDPSAETKLVIDDEIVATSATDIPVDPGTRVITVTAPDRVPYETRIMIVEKEHKAVTIPKLARPIVVNRTRSTVGKVLTFGGAGLFLASAGLAVYASKLFNEQFDNGNCSNKDAALPSCNSAGQINTQTAKSYGNVATYVGVAGIAAVGVGAYLWFFAPKENEKIAIVPAVGPDLTGLAAIGRF